MEELSTLENLKSLWLGKNKIETISDIDNLHNLKQLDVQCNRLTSCFGLSDQLTSLEELYLASNKIDSISGLFPLQCATKLHTIDLSHNVISSLVGIEVLSAGLESIWMSTNAIDTFEALQPLTLLPKLECLYLEHCPIYNDSRQEYTSKIREILPALKQLDADMIL